MDHHTEEKQRLTEELIKNGLLQVLRGKRYSEITVSDICRAADISRGTFYRRFENISNVYAAIFADMAELTSTMHDRLTASPDQYKVPLCRLLRENKKYRGIVLDPTLSEMFVEYYAAHKEDPAVDSRSDLTPEQKRMLKAYLLMGCIYVTRKNLQSDEQNWNDLQCVIEQFILRGCLLERQHTGPGT